MTTSISSSTSAIVDALQEVPIAAFAQELLVLAVFLVSFGVWKHFGKRGRAKVVQPSKLGKGIIHSYPSQKSSGRSCVDVARDVDTLRQRKAAVQASEVQMLKHLEQREFTRALNLYRTLERDGRDRYFGEELYSAFIQSAIRVGKVDVVERMLRAMKRGGVPPSLRFWQTTMKMLSSRKHYSVCLTVHAVFGNQLPTDKVVFSCLINAALEAGSAERAASLLDTYKDADIDAKDHVLFFRTYVALNDIDKAEGIFRKLGDQTTTLMLNLLLLTCVNGKQPERGWDFLREAHRLEKDLEAKIVDVVSYNTVVKGFAQAGEPQQCFECLREMSTNNLEPDDITFGTLLDSCIANNDMDATQDMLNLLMESDGPMDTIMCTLFIKGLVRANCLPKALELYETMKGREKATPDIVTFSVLIKALVDQHDLERALQILEDMVAIGLSPDDIILTHLLEGCRHAANHTLGKRLFKDMLAAGVKPSEFTLVTMLKLHGRCGAHKEAYDLVSTWAGLYGEKPSVIHYTCLMSGCLRTKSYDDAWQAYVLMMQASIAPDETTISTLLPGMVAAQQWDHVISLANQAFKATPPLNIPSETLNNALSQMLIGGGVGRHAEKLQLLMQGAGVNITARNSSRLLPKYERP